MKQWADYGGRGITVCARWTGPEGFKNFLSDMGDRPEGYSIDRINNDADYCPENCRWASRKEQQRNRRRTLRVDIEGTSYLLSELAERSGLKADTIKERCKKGLPLKDVLSPIRRKDFSGLAVGGLFNGLRQQSKTHCKNGHLFDDANTLLTKEGWRSCRTCHADRQRLRTKQ